MTDEPRPTSVPCPWCLAAAGERCTIAGVPKPSGSHPSRYRAASDATPTENRPTATPSPNRPDHTLEGTDHAEPTD